MRRGAQQERRRHVLVAMGLGAPLQPRTDRLQDRDVDAVSGGPLDLPYLQMKGRAMIERRFDPSFRLELAAKDARLVSDRREGTRHYYSVDSDALAELREYFESFWEDALAAFKEATEKGETDEPANE